MDRGLCSAVYVDERATHERWISRESPATSEDGSSESASSSPLDGCPELASNVEHILSICKQVYLCSSGKSFAGKLAELHEESCKTCTPLFAFIDVVIKGDSELIQQRSIAQGSSQFSALPPTLKRTPTFSAESEELYGLRLLSSFVADFHAQEAPSIIVPVAILRYAEDEPENDEYQSTFGGAVNKRNGLRHVTAELEAKQMRRCLDAGAVDVLTYPFEYSRVQALVLHAYRAQKAVQKHDARFLASRKVRRQSWVCSDDQQPYSYLREAMVSKLMKRICNPEELIEDFQVGDVPVVQDRKRIVEDAIGKWNFWSHEFSDDELIHAACVMVEHALSMPELEQWRISTDEIHSFLLSVRTAYNSFVLYHNFRHAIDVLQSLFYFLIKIGTLPPFPPKSEEMTTESGMASILTPFDAFTLLIAAIGHDVGHPGVNNVFLVKLNAPLAQLYNDKSVLEAFHCAAYSQILRRHWPSVFKDARLRKLMIDSILATDMGVHNVFMESLGKLQQTYRANNRTTWGWEAKDTDNYRALLCAMLIKCADISNVARPFHVAEQWTDILQQEFANQGMIEAEIGMESALFGGPPELGNFIKKANGQIGFMNIFSLPLFDGIADILPDMAFAANEIRRNKLQWQNLIDHHQLPDAMEQSKILDSPQQSNNALQNDSKTEYYNPSSVYYTIPCQSSSEGSAITGSDSDEADNGTVTNTEHDSQASSTPRNNLPPVSLPNNLNGASNRDKGKLSPTAAGPTSLLWAQAQDCSNNHHYERAPISAISNHSGRSANGVRNQSSSTYTNNTVTTPMSCTTQASSLSTVEGNGFDEKDYGSRMHGQVIRSEIPSSYESSLGDGACDENVGYRRPSTAGIPVDSSRHRHQSRNGNGNRPALGRTASFMSSLLDKSFSNNHHNTFAFKSPPSTSHGDCNAPNNLSPPPHHPQYHQSPDTDHPVTNGVSPPAGQRPLPRRRSRLRLAFWRRNKQQTPPTPPLPNEQHR